jgi:predicted short-subunit dehydrogenase-like oxidoreductase (DUF2520 family)
VKSLTIIGAGRLGLTLGQLWRTQKVFELRDIVNRSLGSARRAAAFIGGGRPLGLEGGLEAGLEAELRPADVFLIAVPDDAIAECGQRLAHRSVIRPGNIVFHCSGALSCDVLEAVRENGALVASVHPIKSFADPARAVGNFAGTYCGMEGDRAAFDFLEQAIRRIGGEPLPIVPEYKGLYHAASVIACNYLVALLEVALRAYAEAGIARNTASSILEPLMTETLMNALRMDPRDALTGPIARGDHQVVARHCEALRTWDARAAGLYAKLGQVALQLARAKGAAHPAALDRIEQLLRE